MRLFWQRLATPAATATGGAAAAPGASGTPLTAGLSHRRIPVPLPSPWFWALAVLYALLGLAGHDPWKQDDAAGFGIAWSMAHGALADWLIPNIAGQMVPEEGPLAFWLAAAFIKVLGGVLHGHDAARLATGVWTLTALYATYRAARAAFGDTEGRLAVLALLACPGLLAPTHQIAAEPAFIAACALLLWNLAAAPARAHSTRGAFAMATALGLTLGMAALARGLPAALTLCVALILLAVIDAAWRTPRLLLVMGGGVVIALFAFAVWTRSTVALIEHDGADFAHFYGRWMAAQFDFPAWAEWRSAVKTLAWFVFPLWVVVLWWTLRRRKSFLGETEPRRLHLPALALALASIIALCWTHTLSQAVLLPLLPALAVLAVPALSRLAKGVAAGIDWFGRITFTLCAALVWLGYCALQLGWPPRIAANFERLQPGFEAAFAPVSFLVALAATGAWLIASARSERTVLRAVTHWAYGIVLTWILLMTLLLPWVDYGKSYRGAATSLKAAMGADLQGTCLETRNLGLSERASFYYFLHIPFGAQCGWLLVQAREGDSRMPPPGARLVWEGNRPGERQERFRLYKK